MENNEKIEKLDKLLKDYCISWSELRNYNSLQIKALEVAFSERYGESINIQLCF